MDIQKSLWRLSYWNLLIEVFHNRLKKAKVMMFCSLGEKMDNIKLNLIHIEKLSNVKENRVSGITTEPTILDLKNKTTWPGFPLYLSRPSCVAYVHKPSIVHPPILCKSARRKLAFLPEKSNAHFI